jgi:hypothetical protein
MKGLMDTRMNNGKIKIVNNTQSNANNAEVGKTAISLVRSVIIKRRRAFFFFSRRIPLRITL